MFPELKMLLCLATDATIMSIRIKLTVTNETLRMRLERRYAFELLSKENIINGSL